MHSEQEPLVSSTRITILLIDDDRDDRTYWANALRNSAYRYAVLEAESGESGFTLFQEHAVDCVVLDLDMPESGFFTLIRLIPDRTRPCVAVVILTRLTHRALFDLVTQCGAYACMVKHLCSTEELTKTIQEAMASVKSMENGT